MSYDIYWGLRICSLMHTLICQYVWLPLLLKLIYLPLHEINLPWIPQILTLRNTLVCSFAYLPLPLAGRNILCDISLAPENHQCSVFDALHSLSHLGITTMVKLISVRFSWPNLHRVITTWSRSCTSYQCFKVIRHVQALLGQFLPCTQILWDLGQSATVSPIFWLV